jgi:hypothetical protein
MPDRQPAPLIRRRHAHPAADPGAGSICAVAAGDDAEGGPAGAGEDPEASHRRRPGARRIRRQPTPLRRKNYAATSPITRGSGRKKIVAARYVHNNRLIDALTAQAFAALNASPGARTFYDDLRNRGIDHQDALRRLANSLTGILHRCLKTRTRYDETTAWSHREKPLAALTSKLLGCSWAVRKSPRGYPAGGCRAACMASASAS